MQFTKHLGKVFGAVIAIAASMVITFEGEKFEPYIDIAGIPTVCAGITGPDVIKGKKYTKQECDVLLAKHLQIAERAVDRSIKHPMPDTMKAAIVSFTYNVGSGALASSTLAKKANKGDLVGACKELPRWNKAKVNGKIVEVRGLTIRRDAEMNMCLKDLEVSTYAVW